MSQFLNVHILHPSPMANLNRDDTGAPKSMIYGGTSRARWSSQALKRAARVALEADSVGDRSVRSKHSVTTAVDRAVALLAAAGTEVDADHRARLTKRAQTQITRLVAASADAKDTLCWLAEAEIDDIAAGLADGIDTDVVTPRTASLSIAAFGRMFANAPLKQTEAAVQMAHAFSVNAANIDVDYFTAVDDLNAAAGQSGAGHLEVAPYTSGVFYRYFNLDRAQLLRNWEPAAAGAAGDASSRVRALLGALVHALPTGKINATAAHTPPSFIVMHTAAAAASLAPAFEAAVPATAAGYLPGAISQFEEHWAAVDRMFPTLLGERLTASVSDPTSCSADELIDSATRWVLEGALSR